MSTCITHIHGYGSNELSMWSVNSNQMPVKWTRSIEHPIIIFCRDIGLKLHDSFQLNSVLAHMVASRKQLEIETSLNCKDSKPRCSVLRKQPFSAFPAARCRMSGWNLVG